MKKWLYSFCPNCIWTINLKEFILYDRLIVKKSNFLNIELEILQSTLFKWLLDWGQNVDILKKLLHHFCLNLIWTINMDEFFFFLGCLLVESSNLANIKLGVLQSTLFEWSRDWDQKIDILQKWLHNFYPNFIWTIDINEFFLGGCLLVERSNLANIKPEVLESTFLTL